MYYYKLNDKLLFSQSMYENLENCTLEEIINCNEVIYYLIDRDPKSFRDSYCVSHIDLLFFKREGINLIDNCRIPMVTHKWIEDKINNNKICAINTAYPNWKELLASKPNKKFRINIVGLGDVGGTLGIGLRLLGGDIIDKIGLYNIDSNALNRWNYELNQIYSIDKNQFPPVEMINEDNLFDCDLFAFCASAFVPKVGSNVGDVRMVQFEKNAKILSHYAKLARKRNYKGIFAVVSDPVDLLCKVAFLESNKDSNNILDYKGLFPSQIRGYGLGVMHARALYYSKENPKTLNYVDEGRAYGPHGNGLIIANSICNYDEDLSLELTKKAKEANLDVRGTGFKPFIAPALSSGALSLLATLRGDWNHSATFMGGVFMGAKNRLTSSGVEIERVKLPGKLYTRLVNTYEELVNII
ncbi:lactate/malate family dehydrogenase [Anaeromicrobium sediminis]|uniref:Lactate dehydrogenase n=1 Tax=Anaeromicrobium sediminis TaxID=1478221 RepID=A0A267MHY3_9FIRM|nr:lactate dehydrogenase [Anaeromicrobium sediminis]PAB59191.1 lactate dehydrogenase [Anaeromicrobium sediminis]